MQKHIFVSDIRQDKYYWGLYILLLWIWLSTLLFLEDFLEDTSTQPWEIYSILTATCILCGFVIFRKSLGWYLAISLLLFQCAGSLIGVFGVLWDAKLDGEHIINMARGSGQFTVLLILCVYMFQEKIKILYRFPQSSQ